MSARRYWQNLWAMPLMTRRRFSEPALQAIESAIQSAEAQHGGEIRFVVETALDLGALRRGVTARERAVQVFADLGVWDTEHNNGVLIYLLMAEHDVEIIADRGIASKVPSEAWQAVCHEMEQALRAGDFAAGAVRGIEGVAQLLGEHFPQASADHNEQPDQPLLR
jgi:uncharacterized membrane protein